MLILAETVTSDSVQIVQTIVTAIVAILGVYIAYLTAKLKGAAIDAAVKVEEVAVKQQLVAVKVEEVAVKQQLVAVKVEEVKNTLAYNVDTVTGAIAGNKEATLEAIAENTALTSDVKTVIKEVTTKTEDLTIATNNTDKRLDLLWEAHVKRGEAESLTKGLTSRVSVKEVEPTGDMAILLRPDVQAAYEPIAPFLRQMRRDMKNVTSGQFAEAVETRYGSWLAKHICAVLGVSDYACLAMAQQIADSPEKQIIDMAECDPKRHDKP